MFDLGEFHIDRLRISDAKSLSKLMLRNKEAFKPWFPLTLAANLSIADSEDFIQRISEQEKEQMLVLFGLKVSEEVIGLIYIKEIDWEKKEGEYAYCMDAAYAGKGWTSKAISTLSEYAFTEMGLTSLKIIVNHTNISSTKVAEKNGFLFIETLNNEYTPPGGTPLDMELYVLKK